MMLFFIGLVIWYFFIDVRGHDITQNRLIQSYQTLNSFLDHISTNSTSVRRRGLGTGAVPNFSGQNSKLKGVALITYKKNGQFSDAGCSGSYIKHYENKYVLTAAHCAWNKALNRFDPINVEDYRVEFGVTSNWGSNTHNIITCTVSDIRVNDKFVIESRHKRYQNDYAIFKLGTCSGGRPSKPFMIGTFAERSSYNRAGYGTSRSLKVFEMTSLTTSYQYIRTNGIEDTERTQRLNGPNVLLTRGISTGGDSGGPFYTTTQDGHLQIIALCRGNIKNDPTLQIAVKMTTDVITNIQQFMKKEDPDGVSPLTKSCTDTPSNDHDCWSECAPNKPDHCFTHREFADPERKIKCHNGGYKYLCGLRHGQCKKQCKPNCRSTTRRDGKRAQCILHCKQECDNTDSHNGAHFGLINFIKSFIYNHYYDDDIDFEDNEAYYGFT